MTHLLFFLTSLLTAIAATIISIKYPDYELYSLLTLPVIGITLMTTRIVAIKISNLFK